MSDFETSAAFAELNETPKAFNLTFGNEETAAAQTKQTLEPENNLTPEELKQVEAFSKQIDIANTAAILNYGASTQKKLTQFSEQTLENVKTKDVGEVGDMLAGLVTDLKEFGAPEEKKGFFGLFKKQTDQVAEMKAKYASVEENVDTVADKLETHQKQLMADANLLDKMYELNLAYYKELSMYILAGKKRLEELRNGQLVELREKAEKTGNAEDAQAAQDFAAQCDRFEKKLYDLELTRTITMQTAPQIRMIQNSDIIMAEKIQTTIVNTIPLWKNQMVITMGLEHASQAAEAEKQVNEMTNTLLKKNAEKLKTATVETAKASEKGIVDIETLTYTNEQLISAMDEVINIQQEGKEKRREAEKQLEEIETQLKEKLLQASG